MTCAAPLGLIGNGFCNDETNNAECNYDGGDCCGACINTDHCSECLCHIAGEPTLDLSCKQSFDFLQVLEGSEIVFYSVPGDDQQMKCIEI